MQTSQEHLAAVNETYFEHMRHAVSFGIRLIGAGIACLIHGAMPSAFTATGSRTVNTLHHAMVTNRIVNKDQAGQSATDSQAVSG